MMDFCLLFLCVVCSRKLSLSEKKKMMRKLCKSDKSLMQVKQLLDDDDFPVDEIIFRFHDDEWTSLQLACFNGSEKIVSLLLSRGASISKCSRSGQTPLFMACKMGSQSIVSLLISKGASVNFSNNAGTSPLLVACSSGHALIVRELLEHGGDLKKNDGDGMTPLHVACYWGRGEVVVEVLKYISETSSRDYFRSELENVRRWWIKGMGGRILSSYLSEELMESLEYSLSINRENNEKGAR